MLVLTNMGMPDGTNVYCELLLPTGIGSLQEPLRSAGYVVTYRRSGYDKREILRVEANGLDLESEERRGYHALNGVADNAHAEEIVERLSAVLAQQGLAYRIELYVGDELVRELHNAWPGDESQA
jgi:hypothetical protein